MNDLKIENTKLKKYVYTLEAKLKAYESKIKMLDRKVKELSRELSK